MDKPFSAYEYGLCQLEDLLNEVPENVIVISTKTLDRGITISIPKREQTPEEIVRTKQFVEDVVKLLYHAPQCSMAFNKFVPAYHHHFGLQCKVSDYGFTKLIELFEAISDTVKVEELPDGERKVCLTTPKALKVLGSQIRDIIKSSKLFSLPLQALCGTYLREYGYSLCPLTNECETIDELISILGDFVKISQSSAGPLLVLLDSELNSTISMRVWALLLHPPHILSVVALITQYRNGFQSNLLLAKLKELKNVATIVNDTEQLVKPTPFYILATKFHHILLKAGRQVPYRSLESTYRRAYNKNIYYTNFDMKGINDHHQ